MSRAEEKAVAKSGKFPVPPPKEVAPPPTDPTGWVALPEKYSDPARSGYVAVAQPAEMAVTETLELQRRLRGLLGRELDAIVVNGVLPRRFSEQDLRALADGDEPVQRAAARAARAVHARARFQHNQLARLRRRHAHVLSLRFRFEELDLKALDQISERLGRIL